MRLALVVTSALSCLHCQGGAGSSSTGEGSSGAAASTGGSATQDPAAGSSGSETAAPPTTGGETTALPTTGGESSSSVGETGGSTTDDPPPEPPAIHYVGRHDASDPGHVRMGWSGVGAVFRFDGTGASVRLDDSGRYFTVLVDGVLQPNLATTPVRNTVSGLDANDAIVFRVIAENRGSTAAFDVQLFDTPPAQLTCNPASVTVTNGAGAALALVP